VTTGPGAIELATRVAGFGLPGQREALSIDAAAWPSVAAVLSSRRLTGIALAAMDADQLRLPNEAERDLVERHREQMVHSLALERRLLALGEAFDQAGLPFVALKGPAIAHTMYPDPSWRPFADVDVLVRTPDWRRACEAASSVGFRRDLPEPARGFDERFGKAATHTDGSGLQLDLHRTLTLGPFGLWLDPAVLFEETTSFELGGRSFRRLNDTAMLLHVAMHASLGAAPPLPLPLRDVAQLALLGDVDWEAVAERGRTWRLAAVLQHAYAEVAHELEVPALPGLSTISALIPTAREGRALRQYMGTRRGRGGLALSTTMAIPGVRGKVAYARSLLLPRHEFLEARSGGTNRASYFGRWTIPLRWWLQRTR
jgi:hypothetical protein